MPVDLADVVVEGTAVLLFLGLTVYLVRRGRVHGLKGRKGWMPILLGLCFLTLYAGYDLSDEFQATDWQPMVGPIDVQDVLQEIVLPGAGVFFLVVGLATFLDLPARLSHRERQLETATRDLDRQVQQATQHLEEANAALAESEERFRLISKATYDTVWDWDLTTDHVWWGDGVSTWFGWEPEELDPTPASWTDRIHPEDVERVEAGIHAAILDGKDRWRDTYRFRRSDGTYAQVLDHGYIVRDGDGEPVRAVGSMVDITEQRRIQQELEETERRFETLVRHIDENYWIVDIPTLELVYNSPGFETIFGLRLEDLPQPDAWFNLVHEDDREEVRARMGAVFQEHVPDELQYQIVRPDGSIRWVETILRPVEDAEGQVIQVAGVTRDISHQVNVQEAREAAVRHQAEAQRLREVDAFKTRFLNTAAHELSTPLTPVKFQVTGLTSGLFGELTEEQARAVDMLDRNFERFSRLVNDLLDSTRFESGRLTMQKEETDISDLVQSAVEDFAGRAEQEGVELVYDLEPGCLVHVDLQRMAQVLTNLLDNAVKFTPAVGTVTIRTHQEDDRVHLVVEDTGRGMDEDQLARVFEPFEQAGSGDRSPGGTGLGLYICKGIVEQQSGWIRVESDGPGEGSTVRIELPALGPTTGSEAERPSDPSPMDA